MNTQQKVQKWDLDKKVINALRADNFVHVTGLGVRWNDENHGHILAGDRSFDGTFGSTGCNNGTTAVVTPNGFYFLKRGSLMIKDKDLLKKIRFNEGDCGVYCSNGDKVDPDALLERFSDPLSSKYGDPFFHLR